MSSTERTQGPQRISEERYVKLGGVHQWVVMRGENVANPPLIFLHGGPGLSETALFRYFNAPLEKAFTLVLWDQRGAGYSYARDLPKESMTVERFLGDLDELVELVRAKLGQPRVALFGHSWGSALGVLYASRHPEKVSVYVGSGQVGSSQDGEAASYAFALAEARRQNRGRALRKLLQIGSPPYSAEALWIQRNTLSLLEGDLRPSSLWKIGRALLAESLGSLFELSRGMKAFRWTLGAMYREVSKIDLIEAVPRLELPVFFFLGRNDHYVPPETSVAYFESLSAPSKRLEWFEKSGHEPFMDEAKKFNKAMVEWVRPLAVGAAAPAEPRLAPRVPEAESLHP